MTETGEYSVYIHTCPNKKVYIGITKQNPVKRWLGGKGYQKQSCFYNAILKYGWDNIEHKILFTELSKEDAEQKEVELIAEYKSNDREYGYNVENGGHINKVSKETAEKIRQANTGRKHNAETCKKLSSIQKARWEDEEYRNHQIEVRLGKETWNKGKATPKETREKQRKAKLGKYVGDKHWNSKKVINLDTGVVYNSIGLIAKELNIKNGSHIVEVCKGKKKTAYGYHWRYYDEI